MTFNKNDIDTIKKAKEYPDYHGGELTQPEKEIFNSSLLTPNGILDVSLLQDTAELLNNCKKAEANLVTEKTSETGLSTNGNALLIALMGERRNNSIAYQLVNEKDENEERRVDKMVKEYQTVLFRKNNKTLDLKLKEALITFAKVSEKEEKVAKEITELEKKYNPQVLQEQTDLEDKVDTAVTALKDDLRIVNTGGRKFLEFIIENGKNFSELNYKSDVPATTEHYGSIIKTGYNGNNKPYTHPLYLSTDFVGQIWTILKDIDKDKLFEYIDSSDCAWDAGDKKKFKGAFERVINWNAKISSECDKDLMSYLYSNTKRKKNISKGDFKERRRYISDIFYVMHALFPKDSNYQNSPFIQKGQKSCLPFKNGYSLDNSYTMYWRGADASIIGKKYVDNSTNVLKAPFDVEEKHLTWANGQIPKFFWQVYNSDEAIEFNAYDEVISKDGIMDERIREEEITIYEKKLTCSSSIFNRHIAKKNYTLYVEKFISNLLDATGKELFEEEEVNELCLEWNKISQKIAKKAMDTLVKFREEAKGLSFDELKVRSNELNPYQAKWLTREVKNKEIDNEMIDVWNEWKTITADKRVGLESIRAELGKKRSELTKISLQKADKKQKLIQIQNQIKDFETNQINHSRTQLKNLGDKLTNPSDENIITYQETIAIRTLIYFLTDLENESKLETPLTTTEREYLTKVEQLEAIRNAKIPTYSTWQGLGASFQERLNNWEKKEGRNLTSKSITIYFNLLKSELNNAQQTIGLSPEEEAELLAITNYLTNPELRSENLRSVFKIDADITTSLVQEWKDYGDKKLFKKDELELKKIADILLNLEDKTTFFNELKEYLKDKQGVPIFPADTTDDYQKTDYFFTLSPQYVITFSTTYHIKHDSVKKKEIETEMKADRNPADKTKSLDWNIYGDGVSPTEAGTKKYYFEKLAGINHSYAKQKATESQPTSKEGFWRTNNPAAWLSFLGLLLLLAGTIWAIRKRKTLLQWWNSPSDLEDELDDDDDD